MPLSDRIKRKAIQKSAENSGGFLNSDFNQKEFLSALSGETKSKGVCWALCAKFLAVDGNVVKFNQFLTGKQAVYEIKSMQEKLNSAGDRVELAPFMTNVLERFIGSTCVFNHPVESSAEIEAVKKNMAFFPRGRFVMYFSTYVKNKAHSIAIVDLAEGVQVFEPNLGMFLFRKTAGDYLVAFDNALEFVQRLRGEVYHDLPVATFSVFEPLDIPPVAVSFAVNNPSGRRSIRAAIGSIFLGFARHYSCDSLCLTSQLSKSDPAFLSTNLSCFVPYDTVNAKAQLALVFLFLLYESDYKGFSDWLVSSKSVEKKLPAANQACQLLGKNLNRDLPVVFSRLAAGAFDVGAEEGHLNVSGLDNLFWLFFACLSSAERFILTADSTDYIAFFAIVFAGGSCYIYSPNLDVLAVEFSDSQENFQPKFKQVMNRLLDEMFGNTKRLLKYSLFVIQNKSKAATCSGATKVEWTDLGVV